MWYEPTQPYNTMSFLNKALLKTSCLNSDLMRIAPLLHIVPLRPFPKYLTMICHVV